MQVTLNQNEIETGIRLYLDTQFNIREGQEITIDLKAGRGPEGFTATIDIVPAGTAAAQTETAAKPSTVTTPRPTRQQAAPETVQNVATPAGQDETAQDAPEGQTAQGEPDAAQEQASEGQAETARPANSIFSGLAKPKND